MNGNERQAYDRGTSLYSPDGRIYQVEYAREAVSRGAPAVGVRTDEGVVLAAVVKSRSSLQVEESVEKLHKIDDHIGTATAGHAADARQLVDIARRAAQTEGVRYGERIDPDPLVTRIADQVQEYTQSGGTRPFGAGLLVGGYHEGEPSLYALGPEGVPETWAAAVIGAGSDGIRDYLEEHYSEEADLDDALELAAAALVAGDDDLTPDDVVAATVDENGYRRLGHEDVVEAFPDDDGETDSADES
ncbi:MAG: archaeal proteasome endopeptidase complex subunit alpha [Haloferacaceae archaeon]